MSGWYHAMATLSIGREPLVFIGLEAEWPSLSAHSNKEVEWPS